MAGFILTPNMFLPIPTVGVEPGPLYANDVNGSLTIVDGHSHVAGSGVLITPAALNINTNLTMQDNSLTGINALTFLPQTVTPPIDSVYVRGLELHYVDGAGNDVQLTAGGTVNATSSGISSGTATASFVGGVLVVNSAPLTPANIQAGSYLMGNNTASPNFITLQPQLALAASYSLTMPLLPPVTAPIQNIMTLDPVGNIGTESFNTAAATGTVTGFNTIANGTNNANFGGSAVKENGRNIVVSNTNAAVSLAIIRGSVNAAGGITGGEGFTVVNAGTGQYDITFTTAFGDVPVVVANSTVNTVPFAFVDGSVTPTTTTVRIVRFNFPGTLTAGSFYFIGTGQRT